MNSTGRASAIIHTRSYRLGRVRIAILAMCLGWFLGCTQDEASPQVPLDPPNRSGETANVDDDDSDTVAEGGSNSGSDATADNQGGSAETSSASQGGADNEHTTESQGGSSESATTTSRGGSDSSSTSKSTGTTPATGSSCIQGINTGSPCDPEIDTEVCERSTRTCTCGDDSTWTCTPKTP